MTRSTRRLTAWMFAGSLLPPLALAAQQPPSNVSVTEANGAATIAWSPPKGAAAYRVLRASDATARAMDLTKPLDRRFTSYVDGAAPAGSYYQVVAMFANGSEAASQRVALVSSLSIKSTRAGATLAAVARQPAAAATAIPPNAIERPAEPISRRQIQPPPPPPAPPAAASPPPPPPAAVSTAHLTAFNPAVNGFHFTNDFKNSFIGPPVGMETSGLCGGMSYTVLDYFRAGRPVPNQDFRPANNTTLQQYFYARQVTSLLQNLDKWAETSVNPFGSRTTEFFNWGLNEKLRELMPRIDAGSPVPLGLKGTGAGIDHDHQVLAIGYDVGRYKLDLGNYKTDVKIYLLDPNHPNQTTTLVPDPTNQYYYEVEYPTQHWRTYFVDGKYLPMFPPNVPSAAYPSDGLVHELRFEITTGADDMRGGADHVDATVQLANGGPLVFPNISQNGIWLPGYRETAQVILPQPMPIANIRGFQIVTNATGGLNGDNWDLQSVQIYAVGAGFETPLLHSRAGPFRFTGARAPLVITVP